MATTMPANELRGTMLNTIITVFFDQPGRDYVIRGKLAAVTHTVDYDHVSISITLGAEDNAEVVTVAVDPDLPVEIG